MALVAISQTVNPSATTDTQCYVCPANKIATVTSFSAVNRNAASATIRYGVSNGGALVNGEYKAYDESLTAADGKRLKPGWVLPAGYEVRVYSSNGDTDFGVTVLEESV